MVDILKLAEQAGAKFDPHWGLAYNVNDLADLKNDVIERLAEDLESTTRIFQETYVISSQRAAAADALRDKVAQLEHDVIERCEKVCEGMQNGWPSDQHLECAAALRAMKLQVGAVRHDVKDPSSTWPFVTQDMVGKEQT